MFSGTRTFIAQILSSKNHHFYRIPHRGARLRRAIARSRRKDEVLGVKDRAIKRLLYYYIIILLHYYIIILLYYYINISLYHYIIILFHYYIIRLLYYFIILFVYFFMNLLFIISLLD